MRLRLFIILFSFLFSLDNIPIKNRLLVPIYIKYGIAIGYNDNVFKFSESEKDNLESYNYMGPSSTYDSSILRPDIRLLYSPYIFRGKITNFILYSNFSNYNNIKDKSNRYYSLRFEYKIDSYNWFKIGYKNSQNNFLRYYIDNDIPEENYSKCDYDSESIFGSYSINLNKYGWVQFQIKKTNHFYNPNFTEFDVGISEFEAKHNYRYNSYSLGFIISALSANNNTYNSGLNTTFFDRSYNGTTLGFYISEKLKNMFLKSWKFGYEYNTRTYLSESALDPLHSGRSHSDYLFYISILKEFEYNVNLELKYRMRYRDTKSNFDWVESLKSFKDNNILIKISYEMDVDLFY